jgi:hypothetical protein
MTHFIHQETVLVLNRNWQAVHTTSPVEIFGQMVNEQIFGLAIEGPDWMTPLSWQEWRDQEIRPGDRSIGTIQGRIRIPTVVVLQEFDRVPRKRLSFGLKGLWERDGGRCQYTGRKLKKEEANIDHVLPSSPRPGVDLRPGKTASSPTVKSTTAKPTELPRKPA